jgi:hypothetical protein
VADGAAELRQLGAALRSMDGPMRREVADALQDSARRVEPAIRASAAAKLPNRGGLADLAAQTRVTAQVTGTGQDVTVTLEGSGPIEGLEALDEGRAVHPVYGNRSRWFEQRVRPGWWSEPIQENADRIGDDIADAAHDAIRRAVR